MPKERRDGHCETCGEESTFYKPSPNASWRCSMCETSREFEDEAKPEAEPERQEPGEMPVDNLDHIRIYIKGPWSREDLKNLCDDLQLSKDGAKEGGLDLDFFAVAKACANVLGRPASIAATLRKS